MLQPTTKTIDDFNVVLYPISALKVACLDRKVASLAAPMLSALNPDDLDKEVDFKAIGGILCDALNTLSDESLVSLIVSSLNGCTITAPGKAPVNVTCSADVDSVFEGHVDTMYKVVFEAWRYNKLTPFVLLNRIGLKIPRTDSSEEVVTPQKSGGLKLER